MDYGDKRARWCRLVPVELHDSRPGNSECTGGSAIAGFSLPARLLCLCYRGRKGNSPLTKNPLCPKQPCRPTTTPWERHSHTEVHLPSIIGYVRKTTAILPQSTYSCRDIDRRPGFCYRQLTSPRPAPRLTAGLLVPRMIRLETAVQQDRFVELRCGV